MFRSSALRKYISWFNRWNGFNQTNYANEWTLSVASWDGTVICRNGTPLPTMSLRHQGPLETTIPSVSIYSGTRTTGVGGMERTFTALAATNFGFLPTYIHGPIGKVELDWFCQRRFYGKLYLLLNFCTISTSKFVRKGDKVLSQRM